MATADSCMNKLLQGQPGSWKAGKILEGIFLDYSVPMSCEIPEVCASGGKVEF